MGARLAAHFANAGLPCTLLDIPGAGPSAPPDQRNRPARAGLAAALSARPAAFFAPDAARLVRVGNFDDNLAWCAEADWILEAVVEDLAIKRSLLDRLESHRRPGALVTSNTSGLPLASIGDGRSSDFLENWAGTHFFNPPRYLKLVEIIPGPATRGDVLERLASFCDERLGKGVVLAKDTPNFIANRIGTFAMLNVLRLMTALGLSVEEVDAATGPALGRPRSATFRTADIVGVDVLAHVVSNLYDNLPGDESREMFRVPEPVEQMLARGWLGEKAGRGFYQRVRGDAESEILVLDWQTMEYRPRRHPKLPALDAVRLVDDLPERLRALLAPALAGKSAGNIGQFLWGAVSQSCLYAARRVPEIADSIVDVDRAMRWGFAWELGPFETWDAIGVEPMARALEREGNQLPPLVTRLLAAGHRCFYQAAAAGASAYFDLGSGAMKPVPQPAGIIFLKSLEAQSKVVERNAGASLIDLGDGVVCCEFHAKMNALGADVFAMLQAGLDRLKSDFDAMVIGNQGEHFSAGANLMLLLVAAQEEDWDEIALAVRQFQRVNQAIRYAQKPVVAAPHGLTLGGGCEICLHAARVHAAAETYIGLVETGVGLIPAGGGCKEMLARAGVAAGGADLDMFQHLRPVFETIAMARVSTSAEEGRNLGYLRPTDPVAMNADRLIAQAKQTALGLVRSGYRPPAARQLRVLGEEFLAAAKLAIHMMHRAEYISAFDAVVARKLAHVLAGGALSAPQEVGEQYILDLEREAFVSLAGERKTQERIAHTLKTGKPLRN